jgi:uncharacterized protein YjiS (DUF1127 family)
MLNSFLTRKIDALTQMAGSLRLSDMANGRLGKIRKDYAEWRTSRDMVAIMAVFYRLSDRQLASIGVERDEIYYFVAELMAQAEERRLIAADVAQLLDEAPELADAPDLAHAAANDADTPQDKHVSAAA